MTGSFELLLICTYGNRCHKYKILLDQGVGCTFAHTDYTLTEK